MKIRLYMLMMLIIAAGCSGGILGQDTSVSDFDSLIESGWQKYNNREYTDAYRLFIRAREFDDTRPEGYIGSGWTLLRRQEPDSAVVVFRTGMTHIETLADSVDALTGLSGSFLAAGEDVELINMFKKYALSSWESGFPINKHDFLLTEKDLEIVQAMGCYRMGLYSATDRSDPDNATYHLNQVLFTPYTYTDPQDLMDKIVSYMNSSGGNFYKN